MAPDAASVLEVDLGPGVVAGFTRRRPGASSGPYGGLNLGLHVGDDERVVRENRAVVDRWAGRPVRFVDQVHGARVLRVSDGSTEGDALLIRSGEAGAVMVADCVPILLADAGRQIGAVVHAGRRGLVHGVVEAAVGALVGAGAELKDVRAVVGPAVCGQCYEVPAAMAAEVIAVVPQAQARTREGGAALDLPAGAAARLEELGVGAVSVVGACTMESDEWYSHRRASALGQPTGRFAGVVAF